MGLADYSYYLRAESGDTTPHDELGVSGNLSGGTITLQDLGGGDFSWRVAGVSSVDVPNHEVKGNVAASGVTIAMRIAIPTMGTGDFDVLVNYAIALGQSHGFRLGKAGANLNVQLFDPDNGTMAQTASFSIGSTLRTLVMRLSVGLDSGADVSQVWLSGLESVGTDPDYESDPGNLSNSARTLAYIVVGGDDEVIDVLDLVLWPEELPDADCAALRDNGIRATLDALPADPPDAPTAGAVTNVTHNSATINWTDNSDDETGFKVEYGVSSGGTVASWSAAPGSPTAANATSLGLAGLTPEETYKGRVAATNDSGDSSWVETAEFTTEAAPAVGTKGVIIDLGAGAANESGIYVRYQDDDTGGSEPDYTDESASADAQGRIVLNLASVTALNMGDEGFVLAFKQGADRTDDLIAGGRVPIVDISE